MQWMEYSRIETSRFYAMISGAALAAHNNPRSTPQPSNVSPRLNRSPFGDSTVKSSSIGESARRSGSYVSLRVGSNRKALAPLTFCLRPLFTS